MQAQPKVGSWSRYLVQLLLGFFFAYLFGTLFSNREASLRSAGGALQVIGILSVSYGMSQLRRSFGLPGTVSEIADEVLIGLRAGARRIVDLLRRRPRSVVVATATGILGLTGGRARARVRAGGNATTEKRIAMLEQIVDGIEDAVWKLEDDLEREIEERKQALAGERQAREAAAQALEEQVKSLAVGGLRLQTIGLIWLAAGVVLATWSAEIAKLVSP